MNIEIDQSVKIKDAQDTVLALSDGITRSIVIPAPVKRAAEQALRRHFRKPRNIELKIFAAGLYLLLKPLLFVSRTFYVTIDHEWIGDANEASIKSMLLHHIAASGISFGSIQITFRHIGKKSPAHKLAYAVHRGENNPTEIVTREELLSLLVKKAKRPGDSG